MTDNFKYAVFIYHSSKDKHILEQLGKDWDTYIVNDYKTPK